MRIIFRPLFVCLSAVIYCCSLAFAAEFAVPVEGDKFAAQLSGIDAKWQVSFAAGGKPRTMPAADLAWWGTCTEPVKGTVVVLADGSLLPADVSDVDNLNLVVESDLFGTLKLPMDALAGVVFRLPPGHDARDALVDRLLHASGESDRLLLDNGDELRGLIAGIESDKVKIKGDVGTLSIEMRRIVALVANPALRQKPAAGGFRAWVGLRDGTRVLVRRMNVSGTSAELTTVAGPVWRTAAKEVTFLMPLDGRAVYLSDLPPAEYRHLPYLNLAWPYQADRNVTGGLLRCDGRLCLKGLGVHSAARLSYVLDQPWKRFEAELGIDDSTGGRGSVNFRVFVDGKQKAAGGPVRGGATPTQISVDVTGAKRLDLVIDYGERGDVLDHADWLAARLIKEEGRQEDEGQENRGQESFHLPVVYLPVYY